MKDGNDKTQPLAHFVESEILRIVDAANTDPNVRVEVLEREGSTLISIARAGDHPEQVAIEIITTRIEVSDA